MHAQAIDELRVEIEVAARLLRGNGEQRVQDAFRRTRTDHAGRIRAHARRSGKHGSQGLDLTREAFALRLGPDGSEQRLEGASFIRRHFVKTAGKLGDEPLLARPMAHGVEIARHLDEGGIR